MRDLEKYRQYSIEAWSKARRDEIHESSRHTPLYNTPAAGAGTGNSGGGVTPTPPPPVEPGKSSYTQVFDNNGEYLIFLFEAETGQSIQIETGVTINQGYTDSNYIIPIEGKGFLYMLYANSGVVFQYYKTDGTKLFDTTEETFDPYAGYGPFNDGSAVVFFTETLEGFAMVYIDDEVATVIPINDIQVNGDRDTYPWRTEDGRFLFIHEPEFDSGYRVLSINGVTGQVIELFTSDTQPFISQFELPIFADGAYSNLRSSADLILASWNGRSDIAIIDYNGNTIHDIYMQLYNDYEINLENWDLHDVVQYGTSKKGAFNLTNAYWLLNFVGPSDEGLQVVINGTYGVLGVSTTSRYQSGLVPYTQSWVSNKVLSFSQPGSMTFDKNFYTPPVVGVFVYNMFDENGNYVSYQTSKSNYYRTQELRYSNGDGMIVESDPEDGGNITITRLEPTGEPEVSFSFNVSINDITGDNFVITDRCSLDGYVKTFFALTYDDGPVYRTRLWTTNLNGDINSINSWQVDSTNSALGFSGYFQNNVRSPYVIPVKWVDETTDQITLLIFDINNTSDPDSYSNTVTDMPLEQGNNVLEIGTRFGIGFYSEPSTLIYNVNIESYTAPFVYVTEDGDCVGGTYSTEGYGYKLMVNENYFYLNEPGGTIDVRSTVTGESVKTINESLLLNLDIVSKIAAAANNNDTTILIANGNYYQFPHPGSMVSSNNRVGLAVNDFTWWND